MNKHRLLVAAAIGQMKKKSVNRVTLIMVHDLEKCCGAVSLCTVCSCSLEDDQQRAAPRPFTTGSFARYRFCKVVKPTIRVPVSKFVEKTKPSDCCNVAAEARMAPGSDSSTSISDTRPAQRMWHCAAPTLSNWPG